MVVAKAVGSDGLTENAGLSLKNGNGTAGKVTITAAGAIDEPELYQLITGTLDAGITYTLRFTAKSTLSRTINVAIHDVSDGDPTPLWWTSPCGAINLTATAQNFVCPFQPADATKLPSATLSLGFLLGDFSGSDGVAYDVLIDNVSLVRSN